MTLQQKNKLSKHKYKRLNIQKTLKQFNISENITSGIVTINGYIIMDNYFQNLFFNVSNNNNSKNNAQITGNVQLNVQSSLNNDKRQCKYHKSKGQPTHQPLQQTTAAANTTTTNASTTCNQLHNNRLQQRDITIAPSSSSNSNSNSSTNSYKKY